MRIYRTVQMTGSSHIGGEKAGRVKVLYMDKPFLVKYTVKAPTPKGTAVKADSFIRFRSI